MLNVRLGLEFGCGNLPAVPTAAITTLGCRVNQYESQAILESFARAGFTIVPFSEAADVYVVNSCSVTQNAESKSRQLVRSLARKMPHAKVVITGCAAQMALNTSQSIEGASLLVPNPTKLDAAKLFLQQFPEFSESLSPGDSFVPRRFEGRTRATIKIQDGCNVYCSYCSIPYTRPERRSRDFQEIWNEADRYAKLGHREIVLAGVLIGDYGPETGSNGPNFEQLLAMLSDNPNIHRIRISSIEFRQVTDRLIEMMGEKGSKICPHLHIPLQSGSTKVLSDMNRPYSKDQYLELCERLYSEVPGIGISSDIMVGFPTESDEEFEQTVEVCERARFCKGHIFRFSLRPGTPAHQWGDPVTPDIKQSRSARLIEITNQTRAAFISANVGVPHEVIVEDRRNKQELLVGLTANYIEVQFEGPDELLGDTAKVMLTEAMPSNAVGRLLSAETPRKTSLRVI